MKQETLIILYFYLYITNKLIENKRKYLFIGDSITVGYGVEANAPC